MTTFAWQFDALDVFPTYEGMTNVVESMHWRLTASDGLGHTAQGYGEHKAGPPDPNNFIPFANLTQAQVIAWLEVAMGSELTTLQAQLETQLAEQASPTLVGLSPPWL